MIARRQPRIDTARPVILAGVDALTPAGWATDTSLVLQDGYIRSLGGGHPDAEVIDASGLLALPGIIDVHGDAVERCLAPRQGVAMPDHVALAEHDAMVLSAGITTTFISLTDGIEPGIRNRATIRRLMPLLTDPSFGARHRLHLRHETCASAGLDELIEWLDAGSIHLLSIADHVPEAGDHVQLERFAASVNRRDGGNPESIVRLAKDAALERADGRRVDAVLAAAARMRGVPLASHDDADESAVRDSLARGSAICEFPMTLAAARAAAAGGATVLAGAPNLVRGASHLGLLSAAVGISAGVIDCLCSDYHPASLFHAPFVAAERGVLSLAHAWRLVSANPAAAVGIGHRAGALSEGYDADFVLVEPPVAGRARLRAVYVGGRAVLRSDP